MITKGLGEIETGLKSFINSKNKQTDTGSCVKG